MLNPKPEAVVLAVGQIWQTRKGTNVRVIAINYRHRNVCYPVYISGLTNKNQRYQVTEQGRFMRHVENPLDLVFLLSHGVTKNKKNHARRDAHGDVW